MTTDAVRVAEAVLKADGHPFKTLSLAEGLPPVTSTTDLSEGRRHYMKIAALIHPDKLKKSFDRSTEAFQCLVRAFECFADPKKRALVAKQEERQKKKEQAKNEDKSTAVSLAQKKKTATSATATTSKRARSSKTAKPSKKKDNEIERTSARAKPKKRSRLESDDDDDFEDDDDDFISSNDDVSDDDDEEEEEGIKADKSDDEGEEWDAFLRQDVEPEVSTSRKPIGTPRTGGVYHETLIGCPQCGSRWEPDSKPQYSLFMGSWGRKAHCQLCLCRFGSATARHSCPYCESPFHYDASKYDTVIVCKGKCKKSFGFPYYPVNQSLIDQIALEEWKLQKEREKAAERDRRAAARAGGTSRWGGARRGTATADPENEKLLLAVGTCVMDSECPLCGKKVTSKHRTHVEACMKNQKS